MDDETDCRFNFEGCFTLDEEVEEVEVYDGILDW